MSWQESDKMSLKRSFIKQAKSDFVSISKLCERFNISRQTGYKWLKRFDEYGEEGLIEYSRRPITSPAATAEYIKQQAYEMREKHPCWGARKIRKALILKGHENVASASTISSWLKSSGYINENANHAKRIIRFERDTPNSLWQSDFKGHFAFQQGRCHPLTILDDHSRYCIEIKASEKETGDIVKDAYIQVFKRYGLPEQINFDNGAPWGSLFAACRFTTFSIWLIENGVKVTFSAPYHPQTNGKIERFHRTLKAEVISPNYFSSLNEIQKTFDRWRDIYNYERPHEALELDVPSNRYKPSYKQYSDNINEFEYSNDYELKVIDCRGRLRYQGKTIFVGTAFSKKLIGIRNKLADETKEFYFRHQKLGEINPKLLQKSEGVNLYTGEILVI